MALGCGIDRVSSHLSAPAISQLRMPLRSAVSRSSTWSIGTYPACPVSGSPTFHWYNLNRRRKPLSSLGALGTLLHSLCILNRGR
jgi:hypothetical protein